MALQPGSRSGPGTAPTAPTRAGESGFREAALPADMDDTDPDRLMIAAGAVISLVAAYGCYPMWKRARGD
jgi:hypothetical protein